MKKQKVACAYEDWDDTYYPRPVCHCLFDEKLDMNCVNSGEDIKFCPNFKKWKPAKC